MAFELPDLPYPLDALEPHVSKETLELHHGKHHAAYVKKLNDLVSGTEWEGASLEDVVRRAEPGSKLFNQAAQHWNHGFYWRCLSPDGGEDPSGSLGKKLEEAFGDADEFRKEFSKAATSVFGSGWAWLVQRGDGSLAVVDTSDAENPLTAEERPLLTCDMWEHAYYIDYRNAKKEYLEAFWNVVNWEFVADQLED